MEVFNTLNSLSLPPWLSTLAIVVIGGMYIYRVVIRSNTQIDDESIHSLQRQISIKDQEIKDLNARQDKIDAKLTELNRLMGEKDGIILVKNQQLEQYERIFQNRDPELIKRLDQMTKEWNESQQELKEWGKILMSIKHRNDTIDQAHGSATEPGKKRTVTITEAPSV